MKWIGKLWSVGVVTTSHLQTGAQRSLIGKSSNTCPDLSRTSMGKEQVALSNTALKAYV